VDLSAVSAKTATVDYSVTGGDATGGGTDFTLAAGTLTFNPGDTTKNISIAINNDVDNESDETIVVTIASPSNSTLGAPTAHTYTILDDDAAADTAAPAFTGLQYVGDPGSGGTVTLCFDDAVDAFPSNPVSYKVYYNATAPATGGSSFAFANPATPGDAASCGGASYNQKYDFQITATTNYSDGIKYFYTVHALDSLSNETINADDMAAIAYNRTLSAGYNMVGIPGELGGGVVDTTIYNDDVASFFNVEYYEDLQRYLMGTGTTTEGRGYYFFNNGAPGDIIDYPNCVNDTCGYSEYSASKQVASPSYVQVAINAVGTRGANMVSNPCLTSVTGSTDVTLTDGGTVSVVADDGSTEISFAAAVTATYIKNSAYRWSPGSSSYGTSWTENLTSGSEPNKMRPYSSYWIFVEDAVNARYLRFYCDAQ
ncbi:MAG: hypothetical protein KAR06_08980, partial [Deltaproteobacteria bacterium]|nr:hypothetical protein [Deltaproteobacteria bacterium]